MKTIKWIETENNYYEVGDEKRYEGYRIERIELGLNYFTLILTGNMEVRVYKTIEELAMLRTKMDIIIPEGTLLVPVKEEYIAIIADADGELLLSVSKDHVEANPQLYEQIPKENGTH